MFELISAFATQKFLKERGASGNQCPRATSRFLLRMNPIWRKGQQDRQNHSVFLSNPKHVELFFGILPKWLIYGGTCCWMMPSFCNETLQKCPELIKKSFQNWDVPGMCQLMSVTFVHMEVVGNTEYQILMYYNLFFISETPSREFLL